MMCMLKIILFMGLTILWAQEPQPSEVFVVAEGIGKAPEGASAPQKKLLAKRASQVVALRNLKDSILRLSGLSEQEFVGIEKLMTFYETEGPTVLENGDARTTVLLSKKQVLLHYVSLYREIESKNGEMNALQDKIMKMQQIQEEQQNRMESLEQEKINLQRTLEEREKLLDIILKSTPKPVDEHTDSEICRAQIEEQVKQIQDLKKELESQKEKFEVELDTTRLVMEQQIVFRMMAESEKYENELNRLRQQVKELQEHPPTKAPSSETQDHLSTLSQILREVKDLKKELGELRAEVFRSQTMNESKTESEIDFK